MDYVVDLLSQSTDPETLWIMLLICCHRALPLGLSVDYVVDLLSQSTDPGTLCG